MNAQSQTNQKVQSKQLIIFKSYPGLNSHKRAKTQNTDSHSSIKKRNNNIKYHLIPIIDSANNFPSIFIKHKRNQYSGYKQYNLNKSKYIKLEEEHKKPQVHKPLRNYEINQKNIAKLRKRYSLEASYLKMTINQQKSENQNSVLRLKRDLSFDFVNSEKKHHKNLRDLMKDIIQQNNQSYRKSMFQTLPLQDEDQNDETYRNIKNYNRNNFHQYQFETQRNTYLSHCFHKKILDLKTPKPSFFNFKKKMQYKTINKHFKLRMEQSEASLTKKKQSEEMQLCAWENHTLFHPKSPKCFDLQDNNDEI